LQGKRSISKKSNNSKLESKESSPEQNQENEHEHDKKFVKTKSTKITKFPDSF